MLPILATDIANNSPETALPPAAAPFIIADRLPAGHSGHGEDLNPDKLCHTEENYLDSECGALCTALWYSSRP